MTHDKSAKDKELNNDHLPRRREDIEILSIQSPVSQLSSAKPVLSTFVRSRRPTAVTFINNQLEVREQGPECPPCSLHNASLPNLALTTLTTAAVATVSRPGHPCVRCAAPSTNQGTCVVPVRRLMAGLQIKGCCDTGSFSVKIVTTG